MFRGGLVFKAHRLLYHSTLGLRVIQKKKKSSVDRVVGLGGRGLSLPKGHVFVPASSTFAIALFFWNVWTGVFLPESQGQNLALTVLVVPNSLDSGSRGIVNIYNRVNFWNVVNICNRVDFWNVKTGVGAHRFSSLRKICNRTSRSVAACSGWWRFWWLAEKYVVGQLVAAVGAQLPSCCWRYDHGGWDGVRWREWWRW